MGEVQTVDCRGLSCPQPVLETRKALEESVASQLRILVDNITSRENVKRFASSQGLGVQVREMGADEFELLLERVQDTASPENKPTESQSSPVEQESLNGKNVVYVGNDCMGRGDDELGRKLIRGFLRTLIDVAPVPWKIIFINAGVKLTTLDEEAVEAISVLADRGVEILSCGTCLEHFGLVDRLKVGRVTNMFEVIESLNGATKVISPD
ncbi:sulfurtransferase-like selenium metabolism protein YedF [Desulfomonile tiedjei]|uniref:Selenium metabolism protein YedF n=1 Tax=Desulfomonile tiedjei (strain ATCC 49306 / DSM 6799 / DCB-1) TaxID=706587 RepID=I4C3Z2_DESTA|nr:sulfurtransferase-like selenium metabolism protein YedF [Desulfomonile tiedjei]AFM24283.1 selenium metabolism protein YedF [Desulfomonile tiedjei DSM 6799]